MKKDIKQDVVGFFIAQIVVTFGFSLAFYVFVSSHAAKSSFLGGGVCVIPGLLFALVFFKHSGAKNTPKIMSAFYLGEVMKLVVSGMLFALVFIFFTVHAVAFFTTFIAVQALYWCAPLFIK